MPVLSLTLDIGLLNILLIGLGLVYVKVGFNGLLPTLRTKGEFYLDCLNKENV